MYRKDVFLLALVMFALGLSSSMRAQSTPISPADSVATSVSFSITLQRAALKDAKISTVIMDRLVGDTILAGMSVEGLIDNPTSIYLSWEFTTLAGFIAWYRSAPTQSLIALLESAKGTMGRLTTHLQMSRTSDYWVFPYNPGAVPSWRGRQPDER